MNKSNKIFEILSKILESSTLSSEDVKKDIIDKFKFKRDYLIEKFKLVPREEFEVLKKIVASQENKIIKLTKRKKKTKKAKKS